MNVMNQTVLKSVGDSDTYNLYMTPDSPWEGQTNRTENVTKIDYFYFYEVSKMSDISAMQLRLIWHWLE